MNSRSISLLINKIQPIWKSIQQKQKIEQQDHDKIAEKLYIKNDLKKKISIMSLLFGGVILGGIRAIMLQNNLLYKIFRNENITQNLDYSKLDNKPKYKDGDIILKYPDLEHHKVHFEKNDEGKIEISNNIYIEETYKSSTNENGLRFDYEVKEKNENSKSSIINFVLEQLNKNNKMILYDDYITKWYNNYKTILFDGKTFNIFCSINEDRKQKILNEMMNIGNKSNLDPENIYEINYCEDIIIFDMDTKKMHYGDMKYGDISDKSFKLVKTEYIYIEYGIKKNDKFYRCEDCDILFFNQKSHQGYTNYIEVVQNTT
jgi:hypothetical protein